MGRSVGRDYLGLKRNFAEWSGSLWNWSAAVAWLATLIVVFMLPVEIFFKGFPGWFIAVILYVVISYFEQRKTKSIIAE